MRIELRSPGLATVKNRALLCLLCGAFILNGCSRSPNRPASGKPPSNVETPKERILRGQVFLREIDGQGRKLALVDVKVLSGEQVQIAKSSLDVKLAALQEKRQY